MKSIRMSFDARLLKAVDKLTEARKTTRSALNRGALEAELKRERANELESRHAAGYAVQPPKKGEFDGWLEQQDWGSR
jgi:metal-responsive CopG/Arc/MetJ family transcriptional regulator